MKHILTLLAAGASIAALSGCNPAPAPVADNSADMTVMNDDMAMDATGSNDSMMNQVADAVTTSPQEFVDKASASDMFEVESAKIAATKATAPGLKNFAAMMIKDHTASTAKLKAAALKANLTVAPKLSDAQQGMIDTLNAADAGSFDDLYISQQKTAHSDAVSLLDDWTDSDNAPLKEWATATLPTVRGHLDSIEKM